VPAAHGVLGAIEPLPAFGEFGVFAGVAGKPSTGDVSPVVECACGLGELFDACGGCSEFFGVVLDCCVPGARDGCVECADGVLDIVCEGFGVEDGLFDMAVGFDACTSDCEGDERTLFNELEAMAAGFLGGFTRVGYSFGRGCPSQGLSNVAVDVGFEC